MNRAIECPNCGWLGNQDELTAINCPGTITDDHGCPDCYTIEADLTTLQTGDYDPYDFIDGMVDAKNNKDARNASKSYDVGYAQMKERMK